MKLPLSLVVCGAAGRMGARIIALARGQKALRVAGAVEAPGHASLGRDAGELAGVGAIGVEITDDLRPLATTGSVTLDFSSATASIEHLRVAAACGAAIVVGSTGFTKEQKGEAEELARNMPTLIAANMSLGVNVLVSLVEAAVRRLGPEFDCEVLELHHGRKRDAPSGTALLLAETAARAAGNDPEDSLVLARQGTPGPRRSGEVGVMALRGGDAVGDHSVVLIGPGERIELIHRAASRNCLASGALRAALWLANRPKGLYSMQDVIAGA